MNKNHFKTVKDFLFQSFILGGLFGLQLILMIYGGRLAHLNHSPINIFYLWFKYYFFGCVSLLVGRILFNQIKN